MRPLTDPPGRSTPGSGRVNLSLVVSLLTAVVLIVLTVVVLWRMDTVETALQEVGLRVERIGRTTEEVAEESRASRRRAAEAEQDALESARARDEAQAGRETAERAADTAREELRISQEEAARQKERQEAELNRLQRALGHIAETRRTAMGLVMSLGSDSINFDFNKAVLHAQDKELLSRIAGILLTSSDYRIDIHGHTDDVGTDEYNRGLSERRAQAVRDYLVEAGINPGIISTQGFGKARPRFSGTDDQSRSKNRRVEVAIVNTRILEVNAAPKPAESSPESPE